MGQGEESIRSTLTSSLLPIQIFDPPHGFNVTDFTKITLSGRKIRMPEDHLVHNLDGNSRT